MPTVFHTLFDVTSVQKTADKEVVLLREPKDASYYEFSAKDDLVITCNDPSLTPEEKKKSFHTDEFRYALSICS